MRSLRSLTPGGGSRHCASPRPTSRRPQESRGTDGVFLLFFTTARILSFGIFLVRIFVGEAWAEGRGELATCRHHADSGREKRIKCTPPWSR